MGESWQSRWQAAVVINLDPTSIEDMKEVFRDAWVHPIAFELWVAFVLTSSARCRAKHGTPTACEEPLTEELCYK